MIFIKMYIGCPTEFIHIGNCSEIHPYWKELVLERKWDDHEQKCVIVKTMKNKHFCRCPQKKVNTECNNGVVIRTVSYGHFFKKKL